MATTRRPPRRPRARAARASAGDRGWSRLAFLRRAARCGSCADDRVSGSARPPPRSRSPPARRAAADPGLAAPPAATDPATLATRETVLAAQLAALEARAAAITAMPPAPGRGDARRGDCWSPSPRAARSTAASGSVISRSSCATRFGASQPRADATVIAGVARSGDDRGAARRGSTQIAPATRASARGKLAGRACARDRQSRRDAPRRHPRRVPSDRLARARRMLDAGQVEAALAEEIGDCPARRRRPNGSTARAALRRRASARSTRSKPRRWQGRVPRAAPPAPRRSARSASISAIAPAGARTLRAVDEEHEGVARRLRRRRRST